MIAQASPIAPKVAPDTMLPDLIRAHPQARQVFDRYGLRGCGGQHGPVESISFFAATHGVDEATLLSELRQAIASPTPAIASTSSVADSIYRRFFLAGIALILTAGATWGAVLLWQIGFAGKFTGISIHHINAHGHAQIFGWVGLFIMGFAYQAFPRIWHTNLVAPRLAVAAFLAMVFGLVLRTVGMTAAGMGHALPLAMAGGGLEIAAILAFITQLILTYRASLNAPGHGPAAGDNAHLPFIFTALAFFLAMAAMSVWHTFTTMTAADEQALRWYIATYQAPLRDLQIHGLALFMILGVCLRMLPPLFGVPRTPRRRAMAGYVFLVLAVLGEVVLFITYRHTHNHVMAALLMVPWLMVVAGVGLVALPWKLWRTPQGNKPDRSWKFVRTAYLWLAISLVMLLLLPVYNAVVRDPTGFSHAYYGAIRHAITVGFISLMIMGFAGKVVPTLNGLDTRTLSPLWGPFILVNIGCFLRVSLQTLTDLHPAFFAMVGVSGVLEVTGLGWWGVHLAGIMLRGKRIQAADARPAAARPDRIAADHIVADVIVWYPKTLETFDRFGFTLLRNPLLRRTLARSVTISAACGLRGVDVNDLLSALNESASQAFRPSVTELPVLS